MLARTFGPKFSKYPCYAQPKLNGVRALYQNGTFQSRDEKVWKDCVLAHIKRELQTCPSIDGLILDGELYLHGWRLQRINGAIAVNRREPCGDTSCIEFHVFDCVDPTSPTLTFSERMGRLQGLAGGRSIRLVQTREVRTVDELQVFFTDCVRLGYEGIMLRPNGPYEPSTGSSRSKYLYKYKQWEDAEFKCVGWVRGSGKADIGVGALTLEHITEHGCWQFNVGTGYTDAERRELLVNDPTGKFVRVRYPYLSADGIPQCPSFVAVMSGSLD